MQRRKLEPLIELSEVHEMTAKAELSKVMRALGEVEERITILRNHRFQIEGPYEVGVLDNWQRWRDQKIAWLQSQKANLIVDFHEKAEASGRATARKEVVRKLARKLKRDAEIERLRRLDQIS